ncbi:hypothetical protein K505DRAFT_308240 [Melanomma pulvis-pyrius CBS 109.77]|uniref:Zn(2)-C6 fungal-type domain-containing protein n=1 Tax=Melanomma pulvis-pyrius CBS 109.77 TaxID=1314802 RepID=A0A6A6X705_9PLEO|nr:hypothetical protein K505DRAFT_308240 [Melanomma pulvis-pyrius CBS 109.77]
MSNSPLQQPRTRITKTQACDACKRRKIKCDRERPCDRCLEAASICTYNTVPLRKGPRVRTARILSTLRAASTPQPHSPKGEDGQGNGSDASTCTYTTDSPSSLDRCSYSPGNKRLYPSSMAMEEAPLPDGKTVHRSYEDATLTHHRVRGRIASTILIAHIRVFLKHLFPIMPVFQPDTVLQDCNDPESLSEQQYAFLAAMCAVARIQLNLDYPDFTAPPQYSSGPGYLPTSMTGELFIAEVMRMRQEFDILDYPDCTTLLTSFFLFAAYGNLKKPQHALFYLHQAISFAFMLGLHDENAYAGLPHTEAEQRRRIYWLLFITERAYSLQLAKPVLLSPSIRKPEVFSSSNPLVSYGFSNLIHLFEKLNPLLYKHNPTSSDSGYQEQSIMDIYNDISAFQPSLDEVLETQKVDILVTRNWLRIVLLGIVANTHNRSTDPGTARLDPNSSSALVSCAKSIMETISSALPSSVAAHGIGMEQKLYDTAASIVKRLSSLPSSAVEIMAGSMVNPKDLIWEYIRVLSDIRGNTSYLLPELVQHSESLLGLTSPLQPPILFSAPFFGQESLDGENSEEEPALSAVTQHID